MTDRASEPLTRLLGDRTAKALVGLGLVTVDDLLRHFPRRYQEPGTLTDLADLTEGDHVTVIARISRVSSRPMRARQGFVVTATVTDDRAELSLTFFAKRVGALKGMEARLQQGRTGLFTGTVSTYRGQRQLTHPDFLLLDDVDDEAAAMIEASRPIPVYAASAAMPSWRIAQAVRTVLDPLTEADLPDPLPPEILRAERLPGLLTALRALHRPFGNERHRAADRMRFEEAFVLQVALARRRAEVAAMPATPRPARPGGLLEAFDARLPFDLTAGQRTVGAEIGYELSLGRPMQRLLQGEVGSGKTVVALRAMLQVVDAGGQAALLAPTEVLAAQHLRSMTALLGPLAESGMLGGADVATRVRLLTGSLGAAARRTALLEAASGAAGIVVGTHALLGEHVQFADLGLVVVDEQHRFGVEQRDALRAKADGVPHVLVMTATPIPRTVAMTVFGDLEVSTLREIPAGREPVVTHVVPTVRSAWLERIWARVAEEVAKGRRVYVVCPRISGEEGAAGREEGEAPDVEPTGRGARARAGAGGGGGGASGGGGSAAVGGRGSSAPTGDAQPAAVVDVAEDLRGRPELAGVSIGVLHGRLPADEKDRVMTAFAAGTVQVLVATTVIEVGVDVPQATVMVVLDAERFGLSQLHQLRGRVGRGAGQGLCLLVSGVSTDSVAGGRLEALARTTDGFELARVDLIQRREGDVLGAAQSGRGNSLRLLRVVADAELIQRARDRAVPLVEADPSLAAHPALAAALDRMLDPEREEFLVRS